jgi:hypothetical protein
MRRRRTRQRGGRTTSRCRNTECRAEVRFFRCEWDGRVRVVNAKPVDGREVHRGAYPEWGGRLWPDAETVAAELSLIRPPGDDVLGEALDLPWYQLHRCQIVWAIAGATREASPA